MATASGTRGDLDGEISPTSQAPPPLPGNDSIESLSMRADPDAQATVTDFSDFTEYLPADISRSLTLIGNLDSEYNEASAKIHELTELWRTLPTIPADQRPDPVKLRADISFWLTRADNSRQFSLAEAIRMRDNVQRHHARIKVIHASLKAKYDNWEEQEQQSPVQSKSPQMTRTPKAAPRLDSNGQRIRQPTRIIVPGEVLAPWEIDLNPYISSDEESSDDEISVSPVRRPSTNTANTRIKLVKQQKQPKQPKIPKPPRQRRPSTSRRESDGRGFSTSTALAQLQPPPEDAQIGSEELPWLRLIPYELAVLRKRMKKNAFWVPSDTMIARELKNLGRGIDAYRAAKQKAEEEGRPFLDKLPSPVVDEKSGMLRQPEGAISAQAMTDGDVKLMNRGMMLNKAKKAKREKEEREKEQTSLAQKAAEDAEQSARRMEEQAAKFLIANPEASTSGSASQDKSPETGLAPASAPNQAKSKSSKNRKRKRDSLSETPVAEKAQQGGGESQTQGEASTTAATSQTEKPPVKRTKTETPVPPPQLTPRLPSAPPQAVVSSAAPVETPVPVPQLVRMTSRTPVPVPTVPGSSTMAARTATSSGQTSPAPPTPATTTATVTTTVPTKPPAETPVPLPVKTSTTPILPPTRELPKRETRQTLQPSAAAAAASKPPSNSRGNTPVPPIAVVEPPQPQQPSTSTRRPASRGKAASQEPVPALAIDRPRRASTARNTPAPETRQPSKRAKRPAPGVVTTNSGGTSAIGKRKAAPRKKARGKKEKGQPEPEVEVEVDDDGNVIDPNEPRYCVCNRVSFGTMVFCDNADSAVNPCEKEWFHLECVGLTEIPARTTKWYCPDCRVRLNIGQRGEVTSRGVKM
ncbi:hypothetical protein F5Y16DRAFT_363039 [Xylariaceae sp. FL0255]|nr:hypothetical protein F5Y16DRAFT_363039 [Xylariaceae sp. FL0255]